MSALPVGEGIDSKVEGKGRDEEDVQAVEEEGELGPALVRRPRDELRLHDGGDEILPTQPLFSVYLGSASRRTRSGVSARKKIMFT